MTTPTEQRQTSYEQIDLSIRGEPERNVLKTIEIGKERYMTDTLTNEILFSSSKEFRTKELCAYDSNDHRDDKEYYLMARDTAEKIQAQDNLEKHEILQIENRILCQYDHTCARSGETYCVCANVLRELRHESPPEVWEVIFPNFKILYTPYGWIFGERDNIVGARLMSHKIPKINRLPNRACRAQKKENLNHVTTGLFMTLIILRKEQKQLSGPRRSGSAVETDPDDSARCHPEAATPLPLVITQITRRPSNGKRHCPRCAQVLIFKISNLKGEKSCVLACHAWHISLNRDRPHAHSHEQDNSIQTTHGARKTKSPQPLLADTQQKHTPIFTIVCFMAALKRRRLQECAEAYRKTRGSALGPSRVVTETDIWSVEHHRCIAWSFERQL